MSAVKYGLALAAVTYLPVLWPLVRSGDMTTEAALQRGAVVAGGCAVGAVLLEHLVRGYQKEQARARRLAAAATQLEQAARKRAAAAPGSPGPPGSPGSGTAAGAGGTPTADRNTPDG